MNINAHKGSGLSIYSPTSMLYRGLKSTEDKLDRQQKRDDQVAFFEQQKENLKNMVCDSVEEIARKLSMFHSYEDQIKAAKEEYNNGQMFAALDEARELGEKIAEEAEKMKPKTAEERKKEQKEEALETETDENTSELEEVIEELEEIIEEVQEEALEELEEELLSEETEEVIQKMQEQKRLAEEIMQKELSNSLPAAVIRRELIEERELADGYKPINLLV